MNKTIKDITIENINQIYSFIIGKPSIAGKVEWTTEKDFVVAVFKIEDCVVSDDYDTIEYGISINSKLEIDHTWTWKNNKGISIEHRPLSNHHSITKYMINEGFSV
jgi:hypothetical protein